MKTDARTRYTKMVIRQSFLALLKEKPINRITVKEICDRSEINRATFYHHYKDPYDLLEQLEDELQEMLLFSIRQENLKDMESFYSMILNSIKENGESYVTILTAHGDAFPIRLFLSCYREAFPLLTSRYSNLDETTLTFIYHFIGQGFNGLMSYWFQSGMKESTEALAHFMDEASSAVLERFSASLKA